MGHEAFVVNAVGAIILAAGDAWSEYAREHNIESPLDKSLSLLDKYSKRIDNGSWLIMTEDEYSEEDKKLSKQWEEEKYAYMRMRDRFEVEYIAEHAGWDVAYEVAVNWDNDWNDLVWYFTHYHTPCEYDGCNAFCESFEKCIEEGFIEWN